MPIAAAYVSVYVCFAEVVELPATLILTAPTQTEIDNGTATFICVATGFSPKTHQFIWTHDKMDLKDKVISTILSQEKSSYTAVSVLEINSNEWTGSASPVKCEFKQNKWTQSKEASSGTYYIILLGFFLPI